MRTFLCFALFVAIALIVLAAAAPRVFDREVARAVVAAGVICTAAGLVAVAPPAWLVPRHPEYSMAAGMAAMGIRLFLTLAGGWAYLKFSAPPRAAFMNAMVACYLVLLAAETAVTMSLVRRYACGAGGGKRGSRPSA